MREEQKVDCQEKCISETVEMTVEEDSHHSRDRAIQQAASGGVERYLSCSGWPHDHDAEFAHLDSVFEGLQKFRHSRWV